MTIYFRLRLRNRLFVGNCLHNFRPQSSSFQHHTKHTYVQQRSLCIVEISTCYALAENIVGRLFERVTAVLALILESDHAKYFTSLELAAPFVIQLLHLCVPYLSMTALKMASSVAFAIRRRFGFGWMQWDLGQSSRAFFSTPTKPSLMTELRFKDHCSGEYGADPLVFRFLLHQLGALSWLKVERWVPDGTIIRGECLLCACPSPQRHLSFECIFRPSINFLSLVSESVEPIRTRTLQKTRHFWRPDFGACHLPSFFVSRTRLVLQTTLIFTT